MINWIKTHKLTTILIILLAYFIWRNSLTSLFGTKYSNTFEAAIPKSGGGIMVNSPLGVPSSLRIAQDNYAPAPEANNRLVIQNSYLSLLVKNVRETVKQILEYTTNQGGYMVNSSLEQPQDAPTGTVTIRVPAKNLDVILEYFRNMSVKVVSENLTGEDVTDQYVDIDAHLATLNKTKAKFEEIMDKAFAVQDILQVQRELINLQSQIDSYKGQQQYLSKSAQMAKVTIYLSTDELSLPYAPTETWRPNVIFKLAVRSLISSVRQLGTYAIWIGVYAIIWIPALLIFYFLKKRFGNH